MTPRLRIIAGPNGSGKTTLTRDLLNKHHLDFGYYLNADEIENSLRITKTLSLREFGITAPEISFKSFYDNHFLKDSAAVAFEFRADAIHILSHIPSDTYFPALLADYIRTELIRVGRTFSFETVMSGEDKIALLDKAKSAGYRIYLYFICIEKDEDGNPTVNIDRIRDRVEKNGHNVDTKKVIKRYEKTLQNLLPAIRFTDRAYLFDNSGTGYKLCAEVTNGKEINFNPDFIPVWFEEFVLNKL